jgi:DNA-binding beta-propeller fold protein YncE
MVVSDVIGGRMKKYGTPRSPLFLLPSLAALLVAGPALAQISSGDRPAYRSPTDVAYSPDGSLLAVADRTWPGLVLINPSDGSVVREVKLLGDPYHVIWNGAGKVLVAEGSNGTVAEIEASSGTVLRRIAIGIVAKGLAITPDGRLLTCDRALNRLVIVNLDSGKVESVIAVVREPGTVAVTKDGQYAVVGNRLPRPTNPLDSVPATEVSIVNLTTKEVRGVSLAQGTTMIRYVVLSPDGHWAYVTHQSPRGGLTVSQLDNGWIMTNALSIIDVAAGTLYANFIFDNSGSGAAHPWGAAINSDGTKLWVTLEGVREVASVDLSALHKRLAGYTPTQRTTDLLRDLSVLHDDGTIKRMPLTSVEGTRGVALSPDGKTLAVAAYFSGKVLLLSASDMSLVKTIALPNNPDEDQIRMGERYYYSALNCYQNWLSCSSCHDEGRPDGLNWDLTNDGTGNPKQTKSHVYSSETPPTNVSGCRPNAEVSTRMGYEKIEFQAAPEDRVQPTYAFIKSLQPEPSPYLGADGQLTPDAVEGKKLFEGPGGCSGCHSGTYFTDMQKHDVGTRRCATCPIPGPDNNATWDANGYDTPSLIEIWRTAPYLHLGTAMTVKDVMTTENRTKTHGNAADMSSQQLDQLAAYVMQIGPTRQTSASVPVVPDAGGTSTSPSASGGSGGTSTSPSASGGSGGTSTSPSASGGSGGSSTSPSASGGSGAPQSKPSSCICSLGSRRSSGGPLCTVFAIIFLAIRALKGQRRRV